MPLPEATAGAELSRLRQQIELEQSPEGSAKTLLGGIPRLLNAAIDRAKSLGAQAEHLVPFQHLKEMLHLAGGDLAKAVATNGDQTPPSTGETSARSLDEFHMAAFGEARGEHEPTKLSPVGESTSEAKL